MRERTPPRAEGGAGWPLRHAKHSKTIQKDRYHSFHAHFHSCHRYATFNYFTTRCRRRYAWGKISARRDISAIILLGFIIIILYLRWPLSAFMMRRCRAIDFNRCFMHACKPLRRVAIYGAISMLAQEAIHAARARSPPRLPFLSAYMRARLRHDAQVREATPFHAAGDRDDDYFRHTPPLSSDIFGAQERFCRLPATYYQGNVMSPPI